MSYYKTFKPIPEEKLNEVKGFFSSQDKIEQYINDVKLEILEFCMQEDTLDNNCSNNMQLERLIERLSNLVENERRYFIVKRAQEDEYLWFCGWQYSHDSCDIDKDYAISIAMETLALMKTVVKTPDFFEDEDKFYKKKNKISETLDDFICNIGEWTDFEVINELKDYIAPDEYEEELKEYIHEEESSYLPSEEQSYLPSEEQSYLPSEEPKTETQNIDFENVN